MINFDLIQARVYVGSGPNSKEDIARLKELKVSAVISLQTDEDMHSRNVDWQALQNWYQESDISVQRFPIKDFDEADLEQNIAQPIQTLNHLLSNSHRVYIHCNTGVCRAPAVVLGYLCHYEGMTVGAALQQIQIARPIASPYRTAVKNAVAALEADKTPNSKY